MAIPFKYFYHIIFILIIMIIPCLIIFALGSSSFKIFDNNLFTFIRLISLIILFIITILINGLLLYCYIKGLHIFAEKHYFKYHIAKQFENSVMMDDRIHELMLEASRYLVVYGILILCYCSFTTYNR